MKILFTGMASGHTNADVHSTNLGFFGVLGNAIADSFGHEIEWRSPSVLWTAEDLKKYDQIFVGVVPPTSLGANKVYGALHVINLLASDPRLTLVLDNPQLWQFKTSFAAVARDPKTLVSKFYAKRSEYNMVKDNEALLSSFATLSDRMASGRWAKTIYPSLPWKTTEEVASIIGIHDITSLIPVNLDSHIMSSEESAATMRGSTWLLDSPSTSWSRSVVRTIHREVDVMRSTKKETDLDILEKMKYSLGSMISPQDRGVGTWWSYRYIQSLNSGTPVVTNWRETIELSDSWGFLAYQIEEMSDSRRAELARHQRDSYLKAIPSKKESISQLGDLLIKKEEVTNA